MAHGIKVRILADSINTVGSRLTSFEIVGFPKCLVAELNTHRHLSRNSASSRAVPVLTMCDRVESNPYIPEILCKNKKGMQPGDLMDNREMNEARGIWIGAMNSALQSARSMAQSEAHKQWANRLIEPFMRTDIVLSGTQWANFIKLRYADRVPNTGSGAPGSGTPMAQVEIWELARQILRLLLRNKPKDLSDGQWHLPYIDQDDIDEVRRMEADGKLFHVVEFHELYRVLAAVSAARCARVSYFTVDGKRDIMNDMRLFERLIGSGHWSPLEMPAIAVDISEIGVIAGGFQYGNYGSRSGWKQLRKLYAGECVTKMPTLLPEDDYE